jgi:polygalacturonase
MQLPLGFLAAALVSSASAADVSPAQPVIAARAFNLKDFGGSGDGHSLNTQAFHRAVSAVRSAGGGTLNVPAGNYLTGPIDLCSSINLHLDAGATVQFEATFADYADGRRPGRYRPMLQVDNQHDVLLSGPGTFNGNGEAWWPEARRFKAQARANHASSDTSPRPIMVAFNHCQRTRIEGLTFTNSAVFNIVQNGCADVTVDGITISNPENSPNTDGIDPKDCQRVLIQNCRIDTGDDCVALGGSSGLLESDILIQDCTFLHGHGCSIGSGTHSGVRNVLVRRCTFDGTVTGVRLKSARGRGGLVENIVYEDLKLSRVGTAISISSTYETATTDRIAPAIKPAALNSSTPQWHNVTVRNLTATDSKSAGLIAGLPEAPATGILLENVAITSKTGLRVAYAQGVTLKNVRITCEQSPDVSSDSTVRAFSRLP